MFFYYFRFFQAIVMLILWFSINLNTHWFLDIFAWFLLTGTQLGGSDSDLRCMDVNTVSLRVVRKRASGFFFSRSTLFRSTKQNVGRHKSRFVFTLSMAALFGTYIHKYTYMTVVSNMLFLFCSFRCGQFWWQDRLDLQANCVAKLVREGHHLSQV